jgi:hypothetical protein
MKGHEVNLKTVSYVFTSNKITQVQRTTEAKRFELGFLKFTHL